MINELLNLDVKILLDIQEYMRTPLLTSFFKIITKLGDGGAIWLVISTILLFFKPTMKSGILSLIALGVSVIIDNMLLKILIARNRPYDVIGTLIP